MDGQYPPPIPGYGAFNPYGQPPMLPPEAYQSYQPRLHQLQTMSTESLGSYSEFDDPHGHAMLPPQGPARPRRRHPPGAEHVKHRRTRSGCYTCRQRRVKCDETRPLCDRCRKGKRECTYPDHASSSKSARSTKSKDSDAEGASSPSGDEFDPDDREGLEPIADEEEEGFESSEPKSATESSRKPSDASLLAQEKSTSPSTEGSAFQRGPPRPQPIRSSSKHSAKQSISQTSKWTTLDKTVKHYLKHHQRNMSHHHYAWKYDAGDFLKTTFLEIAMNFEPLLYAVVAFSAYHDALTQNNVRMADFLQYYNDAVSLLRASLAKKDRHSLPTLLTILQLATIEEFLGDWVNLLAHQRAAHQIITDLFTPQTIMQSETHRKIITWYIRFDLFAGMMSGGSTVLGREWFAACADFYKRQSRDRPNDLGAKFEEYFSASRLRATDVALLFAAATKKSIRDEEFALEAGKIAAEMGSFGHHLETAFTDPSCFVKSFGNTPTPGEDDLFNYREPNFLYGKEWFTMNFVLIDFWAIQLMFQFQLLAAQGQQPTADITDRYLTNLALKKCKMFEAIEHYDQAPPGAIMGCQASLGIASLFMPKDKKHQMWCRRKFALIEQRGYIYPTTMRKRMSDLWGEDVTHWWLPNDEGYPPIIRALRDFIEYRARIPNDAKSSDLKEMTGIFRSMTIDDPDRVEEMKRLGMDTDSGLDPGILYESSPDQSHSQNTP